MEEDDQPKEADAGTWLTSYADLMTLVACFFILMVAFANFEDPVFQKERQNLESILEAALSKIAERRLILQMRNMKSRQ